MKQLTVFLILMLLGIVAGCQRQSETKKEPVPVASNVEATPAYRSFFGEPPTVAEGSCYALVGYYPLAAMPGKISPFPLFMFDREDQLEVVTEQLLRWGEGWDMGGAAINPFPPGTELLSLTRSGDLVRVELSEPALTGSNPASQNLILAVLGHTLAQFEGVDPVQVVAGGTLLPLQADRGFYPDPEAVVPPGEPRALTVAGVWEDAAAHPEEVSVFFDRPVRVEEVRVSVDGRRLEGDYFTSVFDMAVVIRPKEPVLLMVGLPVTVAWRVADRLGRKGEGGKTFPLARVEHQ
jgi:germination protein M